MLPSSGSDPAGRGLAQAYAVLAAAPFAVGLGLTLAGHQRLALVVALVPPALIGYQLLGDRRAEARHQSADRGEGLFTDPGADSGQP